MSKVSVAGVALKAVRAEQQIIKGRAKTQDGYQNFAAQMGYGGDNLSSGSFYGFNPISRNRIELEWIHRGSWVGGLAVDIPAEDMTREGVNFTGDLDPKHIERLHEIATSLDIMGSICSASKWGRLYGGGIAVNMTKGQNYSTQWKPDRTGKGDYCGLLALDRWMVQPSLNELVTEEGPNIGRPKFYTVLASAPALRGEKIHYSRIIRFEGNDIPYQQKLTENLWTTSVIERIHDRMIAFDSATQGAAQLVYKCYLRVLKLDGLRNAIAEGGDMLAGIVQHVDMMRRVQSMEGITLLDKDDEFEEHGTTAFGGLAETLVAFGQQLSGALQIPLVRLFGQSPSGLNSTGESDLRLYYDGIHKLQMKTLKVPLTNVFRAIALSEGINLPDGFGIMFRPLWQLTEGEKSEIAARDTQTVSGAVEAGLVTTAVGMKELKQLSGVTGRWTNISSEDIAEAEALGDVPEAEGVEEAEIKAGGEKDEPGDKTQKKVAA